MVQNKAKLSARLPGGDGQVRAVEHHDRLRLGDDRCAGAGPRRDAQCVDEAGRSKPVKTAATTQRPGKPLNILMR